MPAYPFRKNMVFPILLGVKPHTIRRRRVRRPTKPGDRLSMFVNWRTKDVVRFAVAPCIKVEPIIMYPFRSEVLVADEGMVYRWMSDFELSALAMADGFASVEAFFAFFQKTYHEEVLDDFEIIHWDPMRVEVVPGVRMFSAVRMWAALAVAPSELRDRDTFLREFLNPWPTEEVKHGREWNEVPHG